MNVSLYSEKIKVSIIISTFIHFNYKTVFTSIVNNIN